MGRSQPMRFRVAFRGYRDQRQVFEEVLEVAFNDAPALLRGVAEKHAALLGQAPHMIEIEFLDEPDPEQRFFRIGTDPRGMVLPIGIPRAELN